MRHPAESLRPRRPDSRDTADDVRGTALSGGLAAIADGIRGIDDTGRLPGPHARRLRRAVSRVPSSLRVAVEDEPERYLGPFDSLPAAARHALVQAIADDDRHRMRQHELGSWHIAVVRRLRGLRGTLPERFELPCKLLEVLELSVLKGLPRLLYALYRSRLAWEGRLRRRPRVPAVLRLARIEPRALAACYATRIPQPPAAYRGFWHDPARHHTIGTVIGIDFLPDPGGAYWYLESNLSPALRPERSALYERDPFVTSLLDFARERRYERLIVLANNAQQIDERMARQYEEGAAARGLALTLIEDVAFPSSRHQRSFGLPAGDRDRTLVARVKAFRSSFDNLLTSKRATARVLGRYATQSADPALRLLPTGPTPWLGDIGRDEPFPNVVYKFPERDAGTGVIFLKATSPAHAEALLSEAVRLSRPRGIASLPERLAQMIDDTTGVFQPYLRSLPTPDRRLYIIRAHVLITPIGSAFLSAHRVISGRTIPESLPWGVVHDPQPYIVNFSAGSRYAPVRPEEEEAVTMAALAVARGFSWAAAYGFRCEPDA